MRRLSVLIGLSVCVASCNQAQVAAAAVLVGAHDMVQVDQLLFTTSTDRDELRALDVVPPGQAVGSREYVRAPNPLEALSIPVLTRPSSLSRDTRYEDFTNAAMQVTALGREIGGPWVYATRAGGAEISIVGGGPATDLTQLVEVKRMPTSAPVTASAGARISPALSRLYFATFDGTAALLQSIDLPTTVPLLKAIPPGDLTKQVKVLPPFAGEVIVDLVVLPGVAGRGMCEDPTKNCVAFATRSMQGKTGRVVLLDPETLALRELRFPGPVRSLVIHAATNAGGTFIPPGKRIFGILDEESCGSTDCGGVLAVDTFTGEVALDYTGLPMLPISVGNSLATGLAIVSRGQLRLPPSLVSAGGVTIPTNVELAAVGVITTSSGLFLFFDANGLVPFDLDVISTFANAINVGLYRPDGVLNLADGGFPAYVAGPAFDASNADGGTDPANRPIKFANGAWRTEVIDIVVNGLIPGVSDQPLDNASSLEFPVPLEAFGRVEVGDTLVFKTPLGSCRGTVSKVGRTSVFADSLPSSCAGRSRFAVRAAGANPYVVNATITGYLGRAGPSRTFEYHGRYFQRTPPFDPNRSTFSVVLGPEEPKLEEDWRWSIDIQTADQPFLVRINPSAVGCSTTVASSVVWDLDRQAIFSVFPSANAIIEVNPIGPSFGPGELSDNGRCWR